MGTVHEQATINRDSGHLAATETSGRLGHVSVTRLALSQRPLQARSRRSALVRLAIASNRRRSAQQATPLKTGSYLHPGNGRFESAALPLDDLRRLRSYLVAWRLCTTMMVGDVTSTLEEALVASGCDHATVAHQPRLLSDNGSSFVSALFVPFTGTCCEKVGEKASKR